MTNRLHTSKSTEEIFKKISQATGLQPFALAKIAIALSLKCEKPLSDSDFKTDNNGLELSRQTICGEYDSLFFSLICHYESLMLSFDNIFPDYFKAHIDRGTLLLENEFKYDYRRFYNHLCNLDKGI